ncbi:MAG: DUF3102 domain-containing protein [Elusimicrobiota bacterium]|nr:DUF3102 domain-containing protein [Elusimicrobiota bacterium]
MRRFKRKEIEINRAGKIQELHAGIINRLKISVQDGIEIGRLLQEQRKELKYGKWLPWIKSNLSFSDQTARNYMKLYDGRSKIQNVLNLTEAYKLLVAPERDKELDAMYVDDLIMNSNFELDLSKMLEIPEDWNPEESIGKIKKLTSKIASVQQEEEPY